MSILSVAMKKDLVDFKERSVIMFHNMRVLRDNLKEAMDKVLSYIYPVLFLIVLGLKKLGYWLLYLVKGLATLFWSCIRNNNKLKKDEEKIKMLEKELGETKKELVKSMKECGDKNIKMKMDGAKMKGLKLKMEEEVKQKKIMEEVLKQLQIKNKETIKQRNQLQNDFNRLMEEYQQYQHYYQQQEQQYYQRQNRWRNNQRRHNNQRHHQQQQKQQHQAPQQQQQQAPQKRVEPELEEW